MTDTSSIHNHRKIQQNLINHLTFLQKISSEFYEFEKKDKDSDISISDIKQRLENDVFKIAVVGEFNRGKSTLINALLGQDILPSDVLPCSATINRVTYGLQPQVELHFKTTSDENAPRIEHIPIEKLSNYVTKLTPESERMASHIEEVVVYFPTKYCRDKADIIDTPGLNDDENMTEITLKVLPAIDACILVIIAQSPFSAYESDFLNQILTHDLGKVLFVVNRMDEIRKPKDRQRIVDLIRSRIKKAIETRVGEIHGHDSEDYIQTLQKIGEPRIFPVSGALALDGKLEDDAELLEESGFPHFERELERFLTFERGLLSLAIANNILIMKSNDICREITMSLGSLRLKKEQLQGITNETNVKLNSLQEKLQELISNYEQTKIQLLKDIEDSIDNSDDIWLLNMDKVIEDCEITATEITDNRKELLERIQKDVKYQFQINYEKVIFNIHEMIQTALGKDLQAFQKINAEVQGLFGEIQDKFTANSADAIGGEVLIGTIVGVSRIHPFSVLASGALSGYKMAGMKGAAVGGLSGAAAGAGTFIAGAFALSTVTITFPLALGVFFASGVSAWFGGKWATSYFLGEDVVRQFKDECQTNIIDTLQKSIPEYRQKMKKEIEEQVNSGYNDLIKSVHLNLGNSIQQTQISLENLENKRRTEGLEREQMIQKYIETIGHLHNILEDSKNLQIELKNISQSQELHT